jgi:ribosomal protein L32
MLENTTTKLVENVLIVQQARTSQAQRRPRRVGAWRATLENTAGNAGCKWSLRAVNALPMQPVLQRVQTF